MNLNQQIESWLEQRIASSTVDDKPFITLSYAQSWDGSITTRSGETVSFSGEESLQLTHQMRSLHDGILVGIGTILSDDPQLTVREWSGENPQPIILDSHLRTPAAAKICHHPDKRCWILTLESGADTVAEQVDLLPVETESGLGKGELKDEVPLNTAMKLLRQRGIRSLMVEGGAAVITAFLQARMVDALVLTVAPRLLGGYKGVGDLQGAGGTEQFYIEPIHYAQAGADLIVWGDLQYGGNGN